ncbi:MAG: zinc-binding alcohol dehydrogenase family protein [Methylobacteriaceae bacterium]|nr:zinc-binding alcohol dehydrogenase family protein [Methylobacteriaceae bacterium]
MNVATRTSAKASVDASIEARVLQLKAKAGDAESVNPQLSTLRLAREREEDALVEIAAAAVNPSDVKAGMGLMPYAVFPRTPGRDFSGTVIDGPPDLVGMEVFGSSGDLGIRRDGTHGSHLVVEAKALVAKPRNISLREAAGIGVPFITAAEGFSRAGFPQAGESVLIMGVNGKVGQAAAQIATWRGARVIGVVRKAEAYDGHASASVEIVDSSRSDIADAVREMTNGRGADIVFNTVGDPYFQAAHKALAKKGRQILIAAIKPVVEFNIFEFYRGRHTYVGVDTLALSSIESADVLRNLLPGFASGELKPFAIDAASVFPLTKAREAYSAVMGSARNRVLLDPQL